MQSPDGIDVDIIANFGSPHSPKWNVREPYAALARRHGVDEETLRLRVKRALERGWIQPWRVLINPRLIGRRAVAVDIAVGDDIPKERAIAQIMLIPGVPMLIDYQGRGVLVWVWYEDESSLRAATQLLGTICRLPPRHLWYSDFPEPTVKPRPIDWRIIDMVKDDARRDLREVADALGTTVRTVQRRLKALSEGMAFQLVVFPNPDRIVGLFCRFVVSCPDTRLKRAIDPVMLAGLDRIGASDVSPSEYSMFGVICDNPFQADALMTKLKERYRTSDVHMEVVRNFVMVRDWVEQELRSRASARTPHSVG